MHAESDEGASCEVLLVEDNRSDARLISAYMRSCKPTVSITHCLTVAEATSHVAARFDIVLSDLNLPDSSGTNTIATLSSLFAGVPLIALTVDEISGVECIKAGAQDFLPKSELDKDRLKRTVGFAMERAKAFREVEFASRHDALTGLLNRASFDDVVEKMLHASDESDRFYLCFVDVDAFKSINDSYGHIVGDEVLKQVAESLNANVRSSDVVGRWGGDEFAAFGHLPSNAGSPRIATRIAMPRVSIPGADPTGPDHLDVRISHGTAYGQGKTSYQELTAQADAQMYAAKHGLPPRPPAPREATSGSVTKGNVDAAHLAS